MPATRPTAHLPDHNGVVFESADPGRTEAFLTAIFGARTRISGDRENYRYRLTRLVLDSVQLGTVEQTATTEHRADPLPAHLAVLRVHRGVRIDRNHGELLGPGDVAISGQPGQKLHLQHASTHYSAVLLPIQAAANAARVRPEDELGPLHFHSLRPSRPAATRRWLQTVEYITGSLREYPDAMTQPLLAGAATRLLAATLLTTFPNTWTTEPHHQDRTDATSTTLTRAIDFIETNADIDISVVDIARAACVTVRAVQLAFRRQLDTTPTAYLRRIRLERAHEQLRAADPHDATTTITQIAARWGFADPSRFTALYRRAYGQPPSQTLRN